MGSVDERKFAARGDAERIVVEFAALFGREAVGVGGGCSHGSRGLENVASAVTPMIWAVM